MRLPLTLAAVAAVVSPLHAGHIIEIDTDGLDDGVLTFNPQFNFGGDTSTASQSAAATAFGTTGGDSIFGGDATSTVDTYVFAYSPESQPDNLVIPAGTDLGEGNIGTGLVGGAFGTYRVYALWPETNNVTGGLVNYDVVTPGDSFQISLDQNGRGDAWALLGEIEYTGGVITVTQRSSSNTFVSMRASGVLFEYVPAPGAGALCLVAGLASARRRRIIA
ncbi:MAG: hypothetical protein Tsb0013_10650 [Phycisphaerales bacterium]